MRSMEFRENGPTAASMCRFCHCNRIISEICLYQITADADVIFFTYLPTKFMSNSLREYAQQFLHCIGCTIHNSLPCSRDGISVTPILGVLVAIGCGLALVAVAIIFVLRFRPSNSSEGSANVAYTVRNNGVNEFKVHEGLCKISLD